MSFLPSQLLPQGEYFGLLAEYDSPEHLAKSDCAFACLVKPCDLQSLEATIDDAFVRALEACPYDEYCDTQLETLCAVAVGA